MAAQLDEIKARLAAAEQELFAGEQAAPGAALRKHLGQPADGDQALLDRLPELRRNVETLRLAVEGAEQAELARKREAQQLAAAAAKRATRQHVGVLKRSANEASRAVRDLAKAYATMVDARRKANATAPARVRSEFILDAALSDDRLARLLVCELGRQIKENGVPAPASLTQWTRDIERNGRVVPFAELIEIYLGRVRPFLEIQSERPSAATAAVEEGAAVVEPPAPAAADLPAELTETEALIAAELIRMKGAA